jgi:hypothetical protein
LKLIICMFIKQIILKKISHMYCFYIS